MSESLAKEFAEYHDIEVQGWMLSPIWEIWVGCDTCTELGEEAPCWGQTSCHGYWNGCGCRDCTEQDRRESNGNEASD